MVRNYKLCIFGQKENLTSQVIISENNSACTKVSRLGEQQFPRSFFFLFVVITMCLQIISCTDTATFSPPQLYLQFALS